MRSQLHASRLRTSSVTNVALRRVMMCLTRTTRRGCRALTIILLVPIPLYTPPSAVASTATPDDVPRSPCQTGDCGHPRARLWIACDQCQRWYHCLCASVAQESQVRALRMLSLLLDTRLTIYTTILTLIHLLSSIHDRRTPFYPRPIIDVSTTSGLAGVAPSLRREFLRNFVLE